MTTGVDRERVDVRDEERVVGRDDTRVVRVDGERSAPLDRVVERTVLPDEVRGREVRTWVERVVGLVGLPR